ncbi:hypothetical protein, partial [Xanthomonas oryzae]
VVELGTPPGVVAQADRANVAASRQDGNNFIDFSTTGLGAGTGLEGRLMQGEYQLMREHPNCAISRRP